MRHRSFLPIGLALFLTPALMFLGAGCDRFLGGATSSTLAGAPAPASADAAATSTTLRAVREAKGLNATEQEAPSTPKPKVVLNGKIGKSIRIGSTRWKVLKASMSPDIRQGNSVERAAGVFVVVKLKATMLGQKLANIDEGQIKVVDDLNRQFYPSRKSYVLGAGSFFHVPAANEPMSIYDSLVVPVKRSASHAGTVCFDVPRDAVALQLQVSDVRDFSKVKIERLSGEVGVFDLKLD